LKKKKPKPSTEQQIASALRAVWKISDQRKECLKRSKVKGVANAHLCSWCEKITTDWSVDHVRRVGVRPGSRNATTETWDSYIENMFCPTFGLQTLCRQCHHYKTQAEKIKE